MKLIVAYCRNFGIGWKNTLPWRLKEDMQRFKKHTIGNGNNAVIMGRNTWNSLPNKFKPLPKRVNIVLTRTPISSFKIPPPFHFSSLEEASIFCKEKKYDNIWIIGGGKLYKESLEKGYVDKIYTTYIDGDFLCDTFFPPIPTSFVLERKNPFYKVNGLTYTFQTYMSI
jgi:dihydrofolate reductase